MPIYEYECRECGHRFEYLVLRTTPPAECPSCKKTNLEQLISAFGMSSESTRQSSLSSARKKAAVVQKEKQHEEHKEILAHYDEHH
jgi:putative FmdB family regulatory protein